MVAGVSGISPLAAQAITARCELDAGGGPVAAVSAVAAALTDQIELCAEVLPSRISSPLYRERRHSPSLHSRICKAKLSAFESVSECLEAFYGDKAERDTIKQRVADLIKLIQNERSKNITKLQKLGETIEDAKDADHYKIQGELLTASLHLAVKGATEIDVVNYYDEEQAMIAIKLDPLLTPSENAQRYFKKYNKMKNSVAVVLEQMTVAQGEIRYLENVLQQLASAAMTDIEEIREELIEQGYVRRRGKQLKRSKKNDRPLLTCFTSSEGVSIYVGKNNTQNEYVTNRLAGPSDTWLHTKDIPGSHVVIRGSFGDETLLEAAMLAAYFSQAKTSSQVPVDYTLIRHVRKPSGAKPGFVIYDKQKTLYVTPDEQRIKSIVRAVN